MFISLIKRLNYRLVWTFIISITIFLLYSYTILIHIGLLTFFMPICYVNYRNSIVVNKLNIKGNSIHSCNQICAYRDDICLVARNHQSIREVFKFWKTISTNIFAYKRNYMCQSKIYKGNAEFTHGCVSFEIEGTIHLSWCWIKWRE